MEYLKTWHAFNVIYLFLEMKQYIFSKSGSKLFQKLKGRH